MNVSIKTSDDNFQFSFDDKSKRICCELLNHQWKTKIDESYGSKATDVDCVIILRNATNPLVIVRCYFIY